MLAWIRRIFRQAQHWLMWLGVAVLVLSMMLVSSFRGCGRTTSPDQTAELQKQIADLRQQLEAKQDAKSQPIIVNVPEPKVDLGKFVKGVREGPGHGTLEIYPDGAAIATTATPKAQQEELQREKAEAEDTKEKVAELQEELEQIEKCIIDRKDALSVCRRVAREARLSNLAIDAAVERQANRDAETNEREIARLQKLKAKTSSR